MDLSSSYRICRVDVEPKFWLGTYGAFHYEISLYFICTFTHKNSWFYRSDNYFASIIATTNERTNEKTSHIITSIRKLLVVAYEVNSTNKHSQSYSAPMVMLISSDTIFVWWYHLFVSKTTAIKRGYIIYALERKSKRTENAEIRRILRLEFKVKRATERFPTTNVERDFQTPRGTEGIERGADGAFVVKYETERERGNRFYLQLIRSLVIERLLSGRATHLFRRAALSLPASRTYNDTPAAAPKSTIFHPLSAPARRDALRRPPRKISYFPQCVINVKRK